MRILKPLTVLIIFIAAGMAFFGGDRTENKAENGEPELYLYEGKENLRCLYYNEKDFVNIRNFEVKEVQGSIQGCILPHHLTASEMIHQVFQNAAGNKYETVVLIGPDHESIQKGKVFTTLEDWQTPMGILETDEEITAKLLSNSFVAESDEKLTLEHSISGIIPFVKYYFGDVKVVTLALTRQIKLEDLEILTDRLCESIDSEKTLFIASVDFSHYLDLENADRMDLISMDAIENRNIDKIMSFTNDNLDSPVSIAAILQLMNKLNADNTCLLNHSNTELITKTKMKETTSYLTYLFY
jgi:hypothetical protein